jgi:pimeloyl-ACP methyl ester carboxylesterase
MTWRLYLLALCFLVLVFGAWTYAAPRWQTDPDPPPMPTPDKSGMAPVNGISMYYAIYGHGPPILLIHGGLSSSDVWAGVIPLLDKQHEVIVADSRGQGRSTQTSERLTYGLMANDYLALLDYLKVSQVALVGWSDGGNIGLDLAIHHPDRLTALFSQAADASPDGLVAFSQPQKQDFLSRLKHYAGAAKRRIDTIFDIGKSRLLAMFGYHDAGPPPPTVALQREIFQLWATEPHYTEQQLASIRVRTAIVSGDHDNAVRLDHTKYLARTIPNAQLVILPDVGHAAMLQDPAGYARAVLNFVNDTAPAPPPSPRQARQPE